MFTISELVHFISFQICSDDYENYYFLLILSIIEFAGCIVGLILSKKF